MAELGRVCRPSDGLEHYWNLALVYELSDRFLLHITVYSVER